MNTKISYIFIVIGAIVAFYGQVVKNENQYLVIGGIVLLMLGIYRLARTIPSKSDKDDHSNESK